MRKVVLKSILKCCIRLLFVENLCAFHVMLTVIMEHLKVEKYITFFVVDSLLTKIPETYIRIITMRI